MPKYTEWCDELVRDLAEPFARELHAQKDRRGTFVSVRHYVNRLNALVGPQGWSMEAPISFHAGNKLGLAVGVTILGVTKWNVGDEMEDHGEPIEYQDDRGETKEKVVDFGSSSTNSWAQSFKRCLAYGFDLGGYLYDKEWTKQYLANRPAQEAQRGQVPTAPPKEYERAGRETTPACPECNGPMWDNRESKRNPKAPDFKCKTKTCDGAVWGSGKKKRGTPAPTGSPFADEEWDMEEERAGRPGSDGLPF